MLRKLSRIPALIGALLFMFVQFAGVSPATGQVTLRDAETEWFLRKITRPIFEAANLTPESIDLYIVADNSLNAFVVGGQNIFMHTGTILAADDVNELIGVYAHETGHISGAHLARMQDGAKGATAMTLLGLLLGAVAIAAGSPDAGVALMMGGQSMGQRVFLKYTRVQEASADQAAVRFMETAGISGRGLIEFFGRIRKESAFIRQYIDPYAQSHPMPTERIQILTERLKDSPYFDKPSDPVDQYWFERIKAKLIGYMYRPEATLALYPVDDTSVKARYARVYAYNKAIEWDKALAEAQSLIDEFPDDPFFHEIKGQIYLENGKVAESIPEYRKANNLAPRQPMIMAGLSQALVAMEMPDYDREAARLLEQAVLVDPYNDRAWYYLSIIYTRSGDEAKASLAKAELFLLRGQIGNAMMNARQAINAFPVGTPSWMRANDLLALVETSMQERQGRRRR